LLLGDFESRGFAAYCDEWQAADAFYNQQATISTAKESINGVVKGVDKDGALRLQLSDGRVERFIGGELSLRLAK
jgi:BirA family biotin operon repressor/biotin-[acetyl-CoA-carboxylase] ligase